MNMTASQLLKACKNNSYILVRYTDGSLAAINTKVANLSSTKRKYEATTITQFVAYSPCDFNTYISYKIPFITSANA